MRKVWRGASATAGVVLALFGSLLPGGDQAQAADVEITTNSGSVDLNTKSGTTVHVVSGITVTGDISATNSAWTLGNDGTVNGTNAISLTAGGTVNNAAGAAVMATNSAVTLGNISTHVGEGTVLNGGTLNGGNSGDAVALYGGGTVTNLAGAQITSTSTSNAVSLSGGTSRAAINSGVISNTGSSFATGILIQGGAGTITNNVSGTIYGAFNGIYTSGSAPLTLINDGSITSTRGAAVELHGGGTITNAGSISSPIDGMTISGAATVTNRGSIGSTGSGRSVAFSGSGAHTLSLDTGSVLGGNVQGGTGTDNLVLLGTGTESIAKFLNFETLAMRGTDWTLTGNGTFTTGATVESGRLAVNGTLTTPTLSILSGGILGGGGTIAGAVANGGTIAPGNSIGTLTVASILFSPNSLFSVEINPGVADELVVTGTGPGAATIGSNVRVLVSPASGTYTSGTSYPILASGSAISGTFAGVIDNSAFLDFALDYVHTANQVWLTITTVADFASVAQTPNQKAAAQGAQALGPGNGVYDAVVALDASTARTAYDLLSGEIHASAKGALIDKSRFMREAVLGRLRDRLDPTLFQATPMAYAAPDRRAAAPPWPDASDGGHFSTWAHAFGGSASLSGDGNAAELDRQGGGFFAGGDWTGDGGWRFGAATGIDAATLDQPARASSASVDGYHLAAYGGFDGDTFRARAGTAIAWRNLSTRRDVAFPGYTDTLTADYGARTTQIFGEVAKPVGFGDMTLEPFVGAAWIGVDVDSFTEQGGAAALTAPASHTATTLTMVGLRFAKPLQLGGAATRLTGTIGWEHAFDGLAPTSDLAFGGGTPFTVAGTPRALDVIKLDLGLAAVLGSQATGVLAYTGVIGGGIQDHALTGRLTIGF